MLALVGADTATAAEIRKADRSDPRDTPGNPLDIAATRAVFERSIGRLTLRVRFHRPAPTPIPSDESLTFWLSARPNRKLNVCFDEVAGDISAHIGFDGPSPAQYRVHNGVESGTPKPLSYAFSADRRVLIAVIRDPAVQGRDLRCFDATSDLESQSDAFDSLDVAYFRLPLRSLAVRKASHRGRSFRHPGYTRLRIRSVEAARVKVLVARAGHVVRRKSFRQRHGSRTRLRFNWSCRRTGRYRYRVTASDEYGNRRVRRGSWTVSSRRCRALRRANR